MVDLRLDSSSDSESDSGSLGSPCVSKDIFDEHGRPRVKPNYSFIGESSVLSRAREFIPLFREATLKLNDPKILPLVTDAEIRLPERHVDSLIDEEDDDASSSSSFGVEVDLGIGVFDVNGAIDDDALMSAGVPIIQAPDKEVSVSTHSTPLIQEVENR